MAGASLEGCVFFFRAAGLAGDLAASVSTFSSTGQYFPICQHDTERLGRMQRTAARHRHVSWMTKTASTERMHWGRSHRRIEL